MHSASGSGQKALNLFVDYILRNVPDNLIGNLAALEE
jgi:hypothetical protein